MYHIIYTANENDDHDHLIRKMIQTTIEESIPVGEEQPTIRAGFWSPKDSGGGFRVHVTVEYEMISGVDVKLATLWRELERYGKANPSINLNLPGRVSRWPNNWFCQVPDTTLFNRAHLGKFMRREMEGIEGIDARVNLFTNEESRYLGKADEGVYLKLIHSVEVLGNPFRARLVIKEIRRQAALRDAVLDFRNGSKLFELMGSDVMVGLTARNGQVNVVMPRHVPVEYSEVLISKSSPWKGVDYDILFNMELDRA